MLNPLEMDSVHRKLEALEACIQTVLIRPDILTVPESLGRDVEVRKLRDLPPKPGLSKPRGQARLMHDLASIELQAMELGLRTLIEFPEAPHDFREALAEIVRDEGRHLQLCLRALDSLGYRFGSFPVHIMLWESVASSDSLLDRILVVHRYLEGSGLDAGESILNRLSGVDAKFVREVVGVISAEEVGHVVFGSNWYREVCRLEKLDPADDFGPRLNKLIHRIPRRMERLALNQRRQAGFSDGELEFLESLQTRWSTNDQRVHV